MKEKYTDEYLLDKLRELLSKHNEIKGILIDKEPDFPTRKCYIRAFGSLANACKLIGYDNYKKSNFTIKDAQKVLDERNGHFDLLKFNGMGEKGVVKCKECGDTFEVVPDSLLRNKTEEHFGCKNCNKEKYKNKLAVEIIQEVPIKLSLKEIQEKYPYKENYGYIYEIYNLENSKRYIGSTIKPYNRWRGHIWSAFSNSSISYNYPLQSAIRKYGIDKFIFNILYENIPISKLADKEKEMIIKYNTFASDGWGYNQTLETECALRDSSIKPKGTLCALLDDNGDISIIFDSYHDAARKLFDNDNMATKICAVCNNKRKSCHGMKFIKLEGGDLIA